MSSPSERGERGFTLIEVLAAVLIVCLVFGVLLQSVTRNLRDLSRAREDAHAAQVAEDRARELARGIAAGDKIEDGVSEAPCSEVLSAEGLGDLLCQTIVAPEQLVLPADYPGELSPSPLFRGANEPPRTPAPGTPGQEPALRMVQVRAYPPETDPNLVEPFVVLAVGPVDPALQQQIEQQQQQGQTPGAQDGSIGGSPRTQPGRGTPPR